MLKEISSNTGVNRLYKEESTTGLKKACTEFESLFLTYLLKSSRTAIADDGAVGNSNESKMIKSMFDENLALGVSKGGGMGLGKMLFEQLRTSL